MRWIYIAIFILYNGFSVAQKLNVEELKSSNTPLLINDFLQPTNGSINAIVVAEHQVIRDLVYENKIRILRRLDDSSWVLKVLSSFSSSDISKIRSFSAANNLWKLSADVLAAYKDEKLKTNYYVVTGVSKSDLNKILDQMGIEYSIANYYEKARVTTVHLPKASLEIISILLSVDEVEHVGSQKEQLRVEAVLNFHDLSINKVNKVHNAYPVINGDGISISIKEDTFDPLDIDIKSRSIISGIESEIITPHATNMATIIGGAGNSFFKGKGAAWGCEFTSSSFENLLPDNDNIFKNLSISTQNHSYGFTVTDNRYGAEAMAYDISANANKNLLHIFSAGNIGLTTTDHGIYSGVEGYANLSANFKMAKNVLVVAAVDELYQTDERNSAGPTYDGRVKPELVAFGKAGTSDAAATVSGGSGLLQHYYLDKVGGLPPATLVKSILIAGADDVGADGVDFITGYGNMNIYKSMQILESEQYHSGLVSKGNEVIVDLVIPENVQELKVVLVWNDPAANVGDAKALVNNLDLSLRQMSTNNIWLPWVLDSSPDANLLNQPAVRKKDDLNNVEVVTVDNPTNETYQIKIDGLELTTDNQGYHMAYTFEYKDHFEWDYPVGSDKVIGGEQTYIRWDSNINETTSIEITYDGGSSWQLIDSNVNIETTLLSWDVPFVSTKAILRAQVNGGYITSEEFIIAPILDVKVGFDCDESFMLQWNELDGIDTYKVYEVGDKYLEFIEETADTLYVFDKVNFSNANYAVAPVLKAEDVGNTSLAFDYRQQAANCYYRNFFVSNVLNQYLKIELNLSSIFLVKEIIFERSADSINYELVATMQPIFPLFSYTYIDEEPLADFSYYRAYIILEDSTKILVDTVEAFFPTKETIIAFPNPVEQGDTFDLLSKGDGRLLELLDLKGKVLRKWEITGNLTTHSLSNIQRGMYVLRMTNGNETYGVQRLMIY